MATSNRTTQPAFSLEIKFPGIFLAQAIASGILAGLMLSFTTILLRPISDDLLFILVVPMLIGLCIAWCVCLSIPFWFSSYFLDFPIVGPIRIVTATFVSVVLWALFDYFPINEPEIDPTVWYLFGGVYTGVATGAVVGSSIRPWGYLTSGTVKVKAQHGWKRVSAQNLLLVIASLPLRLLSTLFLVLLVLILLSVRQQWDTSRLESVIFTIFPIIYFLAGCYLSYRSPRPVFLVLLSLLLNLPVAWAASLGFAAPTNGFFGGLPFAFAIFCTSFVFLWLICVVARVWASITRKQGPIVLAVSSSEGHRCLGSMFVGMGNPHHALSSEVKNENRNHWRHRIHRQ